MYGGGFGWCDAIAPRNTRGWIYSGNIAYPIRVPRCRWPTTARWLGFRSSPSWSATIGASTTGTGRGTV